MADTSVAAATEQERWIGGAEVDSDGLQESYGDDDDNDDDDDDDDDDGDDNCGGGCSSQNSRAKRRPRAPPDAPARCRRPSS